MCATSPLSDSLRQNFVWMLNLANETEFGIMAEVAVAKTLQRMLNNQLSWRIEDLQAVAEQNLVE